MNTEQRELFRLAILRFLDSNYTRFGYGRSALAHGLLIYGFAAATGEIDAELLYLQDKGLVTETLKGVSPENPTWRISAAGRDFVAKLP